MTRRRVGILGGTFDPIHYGHLDVGDAAQTALGLSRMYVVTANVPPHRRQPVASPFQRYAMVVLAVGQRPGWRASDMELRLEGPSYTSDTLARYSQRGYEHAELFFVIGADAFFEIESWRDYPHILDAAHFVVISRPGIPVRAVAARLPHLGARMVTGPADALTSNVPLIILIDAPTADVSSTAIRERLAAGESIDGLVLPRVRQHIEQHGLYTPMTAGRGAGDAAQTSQAGRLHGQD